MIDHDKNAVLYSVYIVDKNTDIRTCPCSHEKAFEVGSCACVTFSVREQYKKLITSAL